MSYDEALNKSNPRGPAVVVHRHPQPHQHDRCPQNVGVGDIVRCSCGRLGKVVLGDYVYWIRWWGSQRRRARKIEGQA